MRGCGGPFTCLIDMQSINFEPKILQLFFFLSYTLCCSFTYFAVSVENSCGTFTDSCFIKNSVDIARGR